MFSLYSLNEKNRVLKFSAKPNRMDLKGNVQVWIHENMANEMKPVGEEACMVAFISILLIKISGFQQSSYVSKHYLIKP